MNFKINDEVKWFDTVGKGIHKVFSMVPNYGHIVKLTPKFADVYDTYLEQIVRVPKNELNWD